MFSSFDENSQRILILARKEMMLLKHPFVGSEHLLLSILHCDDLEITRLLSNYGINYDVFMQEILRVIGRGKTESNWFLYTPLLKRIIENALIDSRADGRTVSVEKLLLSLLGEGDGIANRLLLGMNIDIDYLYQVISEHTSLNYSGKTSGKMFVDDYTVDFNKKSHDDSFDPVIGRDNLVNKIIEVLLRRKKNNPLLIGEAGVGKTALVEELARRIEFGRIPEKMKSMRILSLSLSTVISGTKYRGEFEERINKIISEVENNHNIILFIDEIHTIVGLGGAEGAIDAANILKPYLARNKLRIIGATTLNEYHKYIEKDKAFDRRFQKINVNEATMEETEKILLNLREIYENYHGVVITDDILKSIVMLSNRFINSGRQPDKSIDVLDEVCAKVSLIESSFDQKKRKLIGELNKAKMEKDDMIKHKNYKRASVIKDREKKIEKEIISLEDLNGRKKKEVNINNVYEVIYEKTSIPVQKIINLDYDKIYKILCSKVIGQTKAIRNIIDTVVNRNYISKNVPKTLLLVGKTGVGKTLCVKEYAKLLSPGVELIRMDMSEYSEGHTTSKIIGSPPGYIGYDDGNTILTKVKNNPYSVVLLDEIEKANISVLKLFLQVFDDGYLCNSSGEKVDFSNTTIFMTSNLGMDRDGIGYIEKQDVVKRKITEFLGAELVNRINSIVVFDDLKSKDIDKIIKAKLKFLLTKDDYDRVLSTNIVDKIKKECNYMDYGARKVDHIIDKKIDEYLKVSC